MKKKWEISRRRMLRCGAAGLGTAIALPVLDAMGPSIRRARAQGAPKPLRLCIFTAPNGMNVDAWKPTSYGTDYTLSPTLSPLAPLRSELTVLGGLENVYSENPMGGHAECHTGYLTATAAHPTRDGSKVRAGKSIDQIIADHLGSTTAHPSLQVSAHQGHTSSARYHGKYQERLSWKSETEPLAPISEVRTLYNALFAGVTPPGADLAAGRRALFRRSAIDAVIDDANSLMPRLGQADRAKMDEYLTTLRGIETNLAAQESLACALDPALDTQTADARRGDYQPNLALFMDLVALAIQCDLTRVITFQLAAESSNLGYGWIHGSGYHHAWSHWDNDPDQYLPMLAAVDRYNVEQVGTFAQRLAAIDDGDGESALDNTIIQYGACLGQGNRHSPVDLPTLLLGRGGGTVTPGRYVDTNSAPLSNLYVSYLEAFGVPMDSFGFSTGPLSVLRA